MPQLDTVSFLTQYIWTLITLFFLFSLLVNTILPRLQQQLAIRSRSGAGASPRTEETTKLEILAPMGRISPPKAVIFKKLFQLRV
uniref:ATP synthase F0 subunit 8 n=1 Tax=Lubomirskia baikalensis TaxID=289074 RepID=D3K904_9METZ|nr:ATP synthase F0 subunit 8 [Lubomirskia baikalensis]ADB78060.1 ATP synthase F0 subunit 8 [Lubomirskia baikalensis]